MKNRNKLPFCAAAVAGLLACSEYYGVGFSHGARASSDTVGADTVYVAEDTVFLPGSYARIDTLLYGVLVAHPGRTVTLSLQAGEFTGADSVHLLASFASGDSLEFRLTDPAYTLAATRQGANYRQDIKIAVASGSGRSVSWTWPKEASGSTNSLVALAWSPTKLASPLDSFVAYESRSLEGNGLSHIEPSSWSWDSLPVFAGDRVDIEFSSDASVQAYLVGQSVMKSFLDDHKPPTTYFYSRATHGDAYGFDVALADTLFWLLYNPSKVDREFSDSLLAWQVLQP